MAKILIVEDEPSLLSAYADALESDGHTVLQASDGETGLQLATSENWEVMFLDIMLPGLDGVELLRKLSELGKVHDHIVVMLTNLDNPAVVSECMRLGAKEHISKADITPQTVIATVEKYLASA